MAEQTPEQIAAAAAASEAATKAMIEGAVRTSIESLVKEGQAKQAEAEAAKAAEVARAAEAGKVAANPFAEMMAPALAPAMQAAKDAETRAMNAADAVAFYTDPTNAQVIKYRGKIEEVIQTQAKRGNLISRQDAWNWLRGGTLYDEISKETLTAHEAKVKAAQEASTVGGGVTMPKFAKPIEQLNTDELNDALRGVVF